MLSENEFKKIADIVYRRAGILIPDNRYKILIPKFDTYIKKNNYKNFRDFFHALRFDKDDKVMQDILNLITINETYFFRENYQFEVLINNVLPELDRKRDKNVPIRILCSPSSTGEEPYSIALHLLQEGNLVEKRDFEIMGIDIDTNVINKAKRGFFTKRSVGFLPPSLRAKYFKQVGSMYKIDDFLIDAIDFRVVNVMDKAAMKALGKFDVIFSRNMLIYFDDISRKQVAETFYMMLNDGGYVFLGHAESMNRITSIYKTKKFDKTIVYQK